MKPSEAEIRNYWDKKAAELRTDASATMKDVVLRSLEIEGIASRLRPDDRLLDVGCGNAYGSLVFAEHCGSVLGIDYSAQMVAMAREAISASGLQNVRAEHGDVLEVGQAYPQGFTAVSCVRCLINLPEEAQQYRAISQLADVLVPGGRLFLIEGVAETWIALNEVRKQSGLEVMSLDWHNRLFARSTLEEALRASFSIEEVVDFGEYYFLSRVIHPLMVAPAEPTFDAQPNQVARSVWQSGIARGKFSPISTLLLYVCRRT